MSLLFRNYALVEVIDVNLIQKGKFFPQNTKNTYRNDVNKLNTHTHKKHSKRDNMKISDTPLLYQPLPFYGKNLKPFFFLAKTSKSQHPTTPSLPLFTKGKFQLCTEFINLLIVIKVPHNQKLSKIIMA